MIANRVFDLIVALRPAAICDDCITARLGLKRRQQANRCTMPLALTSQFDRRNDRCAFCSDDKLVIRAL